MVQEVNIPDVSSVALKVEKFDKNGELNVQMSLWIIWIGNDDEFKWYNEFKKGGKTEILSCIYDMINVTSSWVKLLIIRKTIK